jgi:alanyl-tRNA synthetase
MLVTKETPFYPEGGGQISDTGRIYNDNMKIRVLNTQRVNNLILHHVILESGEIKLNDNIKMEIDTDRRKRIAINHSSTHLLNHALRHVLGKHVEQKGSLVTDQSLRFDFSHNKALSNDEIASIEKIISNEIESNIQSKQKVTSYKKAIDSGALAFFDEKYDDEVRVVNIGSKSIELCGGTHITNTSSIRLFKIISESSVSTGVRRVEAVTGEEAYKLYQNLYSDIKDLSKTLNANPSDLKTKIDSIKTSEESNNSLINTLNKKVANLYYYKLTPKEEAASKTSLFVENCSDLSADQIKLLGDSIKSKNNNSLSVLIREENNIINCYVSVSKECKHRYNAKQIISELVSKFSAKGGGSPTFGTSVITDQKASVIMKYIEEFLKA